MENNNLVLWPKEEYGNFFTGDSYIILHTKRDISSNLFEYTIHAWTGEDTSKDEAAIASYKVIELDDYLGREAQIFSEKENEESETFLSYFKTFTIMKGGIDSKFKDSDVKGYHPKLFHVHGKGNTVHSHEYPISEKYMNSQDVFVLDAGLRIYDWRGKTSTGFEKLQATILVQKLWEKRNQKPQLFTIEKEEITQALCKAKEAMPDPVDYEEKLRRFRDALDALKNPDVPAQTKNRLLKACIDRIDYHREKAERIASQQVRYYDKTKKKTRYKSPLKTGGNWTNPPIVLDVKLRV